MEMIIGRSLMPLNSSRRMGNVRRADDNSRGKVQNVRGHSSVGSRGDSYDNALAESVIGLFKTEVIRRKGPWRHLEAVEFATLDWVDWFNTRRLLEPIGYVPPAEYEARYYEQAAVA